MLGLTCWVCDDDPWLSACTTRVKPAFLSLSLAPVSVGSALGGLTKPRAPPARIMCSWVHKQASRAAKRCTQALRSLRIDALHCVALPVHWSGAPSSRRLHCVPLTCLSIRCLGRTLVTSPFPSPTSLSVFPLLCPIHGQKRLVGDRGVGWWRSSDIYHPSPCSRLTLVSVRIHDPVSYLYPIFAANPTFQPCRAWTSAPFATVHIARCTTGARSLIVNSTRCQLGPRRFWQRFDSCTECSLAGG